MSISLKKVTSIILCIIVAVVICIAALFIAINHIFGGGQMSMSSDRVMMDHFYQHQADFDSLVTMSNQDSKVIRIANNFTRLEDNWNWPREEIGFSQERWNEYRQLFNKIECGYGIDRSDNGDVFITAYASGMVTGGEYKGYAHILNPPKEIVNSIDDSKSSVESNAYIYRHITGNWYLFYSWDN